VSFSSTSFELTLCKKVLWAAFLLLHFGCVIFWHRNIGTKGVHKMLMKLTPGVIFINILWATFMRADNKKFSQVVSIFCAFGICTSKSCL